MAEQPTVAGLVERQSLQQQALAQIENLPSLSTVVGEFLQLAKQEIFVAMDFERVLMKDQALVARLLKVANSSFFSSSRPINTVHEAVVLIGMDNMRNIVYAVSSSGLLRRALKNYSYPDSGFWLHSMAVGMTCRALMDAVKQGPMDSEEAFVAGLLHDIGKLTIDEFLDPSEGVRQVSLLEERESAGFDHTELGERILERWKIPENIRNALRHHHDPQPENKDHIGAAVVNAADRICNHWGVGTRGLMDLGADVDSSEYADFIALLDIDEEGFQAQLWELRQKLSVIDNFFTDDA